MSHHSFIWRKKWKLSLNYSCFSFLFGGLQGHSFTACSKAVILLNFFLLGKLLFCILSNGRSCRTRFRLPWSFFNVWSVLNGWHTIKNWLGFTISLENKYQTLSKLSSTGLGSCRQNSSNGLQGIVFQLATQLIMVLNMYINYFVVLQELLHISRCSKYLKPFSNSVWQVRASVRHSVIYHRLQSFDT